MIDNNTITSETVLKDPMVDCAKGIVQVLSLAPRWRYGDLFVDMKIWFIRKHGRGLLTSTLHGTDFFQNIIDVAEGRLKWKEEGEYEDNFRKLVLQRPRV